MEDIGFIATCYAVTFGGVLGYIALSWRRAQRIARSVPPEDRPWT